ncbi:MAG: LptA/OstA family protein [bacterium]
MRAAQTHGRAGGLTILLLLMAVGRPAAFAGPHPAPKVAPISITADVMDVDAQNGVVTATGRVRITDGRTTGTGGRATLYQAQRRVVLREGAKVTGPQGTLQAAEVAVVYTTSAITRVTARGAASLQGRAGRLSAPSIVVTPADETLVADGDVTFSTADVQATGRRLTYRWAQGIAILEGDARVQNREGFVSGDRIEAREQDQRATVTGSVWGRFRDIEVRSRTAEVFGTEKKAIFVGDVQVVQPGRQMTTEKVTVWYGTRRVVAEGQTRVRLEGQP